MRRDFFCIKQRDYVLYLGKTIFKHMKKNILLPVLLYSVLMVCVSSCDDSGQAININTESILMRLDSSTGQDAYITDYYSSTNFKNDPDFGGIAWCIDTNCITPYKGRTLFKFYLNNIPSNATVTNAKLFLYYNPTCLHSPSPGHRNVNGSNTCFLQRITSSWIDSSVTWNNQPSTVTLNQITIPSSTSQIQNYIIDITGTINDMVKNPSTNNGMMLLLENESPLRSLNFASSNNVDSTLRPLLLLNYSY